MFQARKPHCAPFLKYSGKFATAMPDADSKFRETAEALEGAMYSLDLSNVAPTHVEDVGIESVLLLREILGRLALPDLDEVPDELEMNQLVLEHWSIPHTEIKIAKVSFCSY